MKKHWQDKIGTEDHQLALVALEILGMLITSVSSERSFSRGRYYKWNSIFYLKKACWKLIFANYVLEKANLFLQKFCFCKVYCKLIFTKYFLKKADPYCFGLAKVKEEGKSFQMRLGSGRARNDEINAIFWV